MTTYARVSIAQACDVLAAELDDLIGRVLRRDPHLVLRSETCVEYDECKRFVTVWLVVDTANQDVVMLRTPDLMVCVRFMEAFALKHPEATVERWSIAEAVREANITARKVAGEPTAEDRTPTSAVPASVPQTSPRESASPAHSVKALRLAEAAE